MKDYRAQDWQGIFEFNGLCTFDNFWQLNAKWFEDPNHRRGGWSGVARCELRLPGGGTTRVFLKRQENHVTRTWRHPIRGMATLVREFDSFVRFQQLQVPTVRPLYFAERRVNGNLRAVLITEELAGFRSLESLLTEWSEQGPPVLAERRQVIESLARAVRQMHRHRFQHNCLYRKHLFLKLPEVNGKKLSGPVEVRIIDLEKTKQKWFQWFAARRDLSSLERDCSGWGIGDRVRFYKAYLQIDRLRGSKKLWRAIAQASARKRRHRTLRERS
jgi:hypothetical protein